MSMGALLIPVPEAEEAVGAWRLAHDPVAALGIPAHITLLVPFAAADQAAAHGPALRELFAGAAPIPFALTGPTRMPDGVVWLDPSPPDRFAALIRLVAERYPAWPPYGGSIPLPEIRPHLTVAQRSDDALWRELAAALSPRLPIACEAREVMLMSEDDGGRWTPVERYPLGGSA